MLKLKQTLGDPPQELGEEVSCAPSLWAEEVLRPEGASGAGGAGGAPPRGLSHAGWTMASTQEATNLGAAAPGLEGRAGQSGHWRDPAQGSHTLGRLQALTSSRCCKGARSLSAVVPARRQTDRRVVSRQQRQESGFKT